MKSNKFKTFLFNMIEPQTKLTWYSIVYHIFISLVVLASSGIVIWDLFNTNPEIHKILLIIEYVSVGIFVVEYILKLSISELLFPGESWFKSKISYLTSFDSFIDIICIFSVFLNEIPTQFALIRTLKLVKLVRLVKLFDTTRLEEKEDKGSKLKFRVHEIISKDKEGDILSKIYDIVSVCLILLCVVIIVADTFTLPNESWNKVYHNVLFYSEVSITVCFIIDYVLRVWTAEYEYPNMHPDKAKMKYIFSFTALIDLLSIFAIFLVDIPKSAGVLKILKLLRIVRVLKFSRYFDGIYNFGIAIKKKAKQILISIVILCFLVIIFSILLYGFESGYEGTYFTNGFSGISYCFVMLSGLGETNIEIQTTGGQIMVALMVICGGCVVGVPLAIISGEFGKMVETLDGQKEGSKPTFNRVIENLTDDEKERIILEYLPKIKEREETSENKEN
ncbi:MAG: ion transporter [Bacilli bacterium]|nr:ion transporter [Bacilli bacterium]